MSPSDSFFTKYIAEKKLQKDNFIWIMFNNKTTKEWDKIKKIGKKSLKKLIRNGIPECHRKSMWLKITKGNDITSNNESCQDYYMRLFRKVFKHYAIGEKNEKELKLTEVKPLIFPEFGGKLDMKDKSGNYLNDDGVNAYKRVSCILSDQNNFLEYCPLLPYLIHILLLYLEEHEAYCTLQSIINFNKKENWFFRTTKIQNALFVETFISLMKKKLPNIFKHFALIEYDMSEFCNWWFDRLFFTFLPLYINLRLFDAYLNEGSKILYRAGYAILKILESNILTCKDKDYMTLLICDKSLQITNVNKFFKLCYGVSLKRKKFEKLDKKNRETFNYKKLSSVKTRTFIKPEIKGTSEIIGSMSQWELVYSWLPENHKIKPLQMVYSSEKDGYSLKRLSELCADSENNLLLISAYPIKDVDDVRFIKKKFKKKKKKKKKKGSISSSSSSSEKKDESSSSEGRRKNLLKEIKEMEKKKLSEREEFLNKNKPKQFIFGAFVDANFESNYKFCGTDDTFLFSIYPVEQVYRATGKNKYFLRVEHDQMVIGSGGAGAGIQIDSDCHFGASYPCDTFDNESLLGVTVNFVVLKIEIFSFD